MQTNQLLGFQFLVLGYGTGADLLVSYFHTIITETPKVVLLLLAVCYRSTSSITILLASSS
jgi:hypothetical protein